MNSKCGVQSKRRCESHESCVCIVGFPACGCQKKSVVNETIHHVYMPHVCTFSTHTPTLLPPTTYTHTLNPDFSCFVNEGLTEILKLTRDHCQCCFETLGTENICNMKNIKKKNEHEERIIQIQCVVYHIYLTTKLMGVNFFFFFFISLSLYLQLRTISKQSK